MKEHIKNCYLEIKITRLIRTKITIIKKCATKYNL